VSTVAERGVQIFTLLTHPVGQEFTYPALCLRLGLEPGAKTDAAIRHARDMATQAGLHFPPAVPQNGYTYKITEVPGDALDPSLQMDAIAAGVKRRAEIGWDFVERHAEELPDDLRPFAQAILGMRRLMQQQSAALLHMYEQLITDTIRARKALRRAEVSGG
jgi:hypothetical protein